MKLRWRQVVRMRVRSLFRRHRVEHELEKELRFHLDQAIKEGMAAGLSLCEARSAALKKLGSISVIQEECRDMRRVSLIENLKQDIRYAARLLAKSPSFSLVMILTLALSIGATSAIVSVVEGVLLRGLPYRQPGRLVRMFTGNRNWPKFPFNPNDFRDLRTRLHSFESMAAYTRRDVQFAGTGEATRLSGFAVTAGFFHVLGLKPATGREFVRQDELPGRGHIAIISDDLWRSRLGARRDILGQKILLDAVPYTIVGVMPAGVEHPGNMYHAVAYGNTVEIWVPFTFDRPQDRGSHYMDTIARLNPGVTLAQAQAELGAALNQLAREHSRGPGWRVSVVPLQTEIVGHSERLLLVLLAAALLVLLLACVNAANLLLARASVRQREIAVRAAVGAGRSRLIRQMLTESVLLAVTGAAIGALLAIAGVKILISFLPADFPRAGDIHVDLPVFVFTALAALATGVLFGLAPALHASRTDLRDALHEGGRGATSSRGTLRLRNALVISEITLACVLLIGAGLMIRTFLNLLHTSPGFQPEHVVTATISLPQAAYKDDKAVTQFYVTLLDNLRSEQGVSAVGIGSDLPWTGWDENDGGFLIAGHQPPVNDDFHARYHAASPGYFRALGIPLITGRFFDDHDTPQSRKVLIINERMAQSYWGSTRAALGGRVSFDDHPKESDWMTVVGIVGDIKDTPKSDAAEPAFWWTFKEAPFSDESIAVRSSSNPQRVADELRSAVRAINGNLAVSDVRAMTVIANQSYATPRFTLLLVGLFAGLALTLAAIGTYGVIAYSVNQRIHEFGVRMALGATPRDVAGNVLANGMKLAAIGTACGVVLGVTLSHLLGNLLYGVSPYDPLAICAACAVAIVAAALACYAPVIRALRADPIEALRSE